MNISRRFAAAIISTLVTAAMIVPAQAANAVVITAASAVKSVVVSDGWLTTSPKSARAKITWTKPAAVYGATISGYKIEVSADKTAWKTVVANTKSTATSAYVSNGLAAGVTTYVRVSAITKKGSSTKVGNPSAIASRLLTAAPQAPALLGLTKLSFATSSHVVRWVPQTPAQRGSTSTSYKVVAKPNFGPEVTCSVVALNYCTLGALAPEATYSISMTAKNSRGTESNVDEFQAQDADISLQWYLGTDHGIAAARAWTATRGISSVVVAVLDSGITSHPEFEGQLLPGFDFVSDSATSGDSDGYDSDPTDPGDFLLAGEPEGPQNSSWHGTHVAGIIAAKADSTGVIGIAPNVKILPVRVLGKAGEGKADDLAVAILWAAGFSLSEIDSALNDSKFGSSKIDLSGVIENKHPAKVINLSMAGPAPRGCPSRVQLAASMAQTKNAVLVAAAGNGVGPKNTPEDNSGIYPTNCSGPISVGATARNGDATYYSNFNVDISAPGGDFSVGGDSGEIYSTFNDGLTSPGTPNYVFEQGTSMAAPVVSGVLALMFSIRPDATYKQITQALIESATPFQASGICSATVGRCGSGIVNAATALEALIAITG